METVAVGTQGYRKLFFGKLLNSSVAPGEIRDVAAFSRGLLAEMQRTCPPKPELAQFAQGCIALAQELEAKAAKSVKSPNFKALAAAYKQFAEYEMKLKLNKDKDKDKARNDSRMVDRAKGTRERCAPAMRP